jgi:hypothetical protein
LGGVDPELSPEGDQTSAGSDYHVPDTLLRRSKRIIAEIMDWRGRAYYETLIVFT